MNFFKYSEIINKKCHWSIKFCYYLCIGKVYMDGNTYRLKLRMYHPIILIIILFYYTITTIKDIFKVLFNNIKDFCNEFDERGKTNIIIASKNDNV